MTAVKKWGVGMGALVAAALSVFAQADSLPKSITPGTGLIHLDPHATTAKSLLLRNGQPVVVLLGQVTDGRKDAPSRKVGDVGTTVMFLWASSLSLDQDIPAVVFKALGNQLAADGFRTVSDPHEPHDFVVDSVARDFRYDLVAQNDLDITVDMTLRDAKSTEVLWAGTVEEKSSRFAGISGATRNSIIVGFSRGVSNWAVKASANVRENLLKTYPESMALVERKGLGSTSQINGVKTLQAATPHEAATAPATAPSVAAAAVQATPHEAAANAPATAPSVAAGAVQATPAAAPLAAPIYPQAAEANSTQNGKGIFSVTTVPTKAKVYVDDVYYGTSPLRLEFDAGVKLIHFKLAGYKTATEKVSIRSGQTTELEVDLEK